MRIIAQSTLTDYGAKHAAAEASLRHWLNIARQSSWKSTNDVKAAFSKAKVLNSERVRFEISGGDFRLVTAFDFKRGIAFLKYVALTPSTTV